MSQIIRQEYRMGWHCVANEKHPAIVCIETCVLGKTTVRVLFKCIDATEYEIETIYRLLTEAQMIK
jgi:hypothetical protein